MERLCVHLEGEPVYDIVLTQSFQGLAQEVRALGTEGKRLCIVTDSNVAGLYLEEVKGLLSGVCRQVDTFVFPAGEEQKDLDTVKDLYQTLIRKAYDRKDMLVALGGGVTGDLCGFGAATYKNMVGAFHMPKLVYTNVATLDTLSEEQFVSGMGEVVKHGLIQDKAYVHWLARHREQIMARDHETCQAMILASDRIKRDVVEEDPMEKGQRALLNFGHTLGHGIEKLKSASMPHGHCVAVGFLAACEISAARGYLQKDEVDGLRRLMEGFHMPLWVEGVAAEQVLEAVRHDKKMDAGQIRFILLKELGKAFVDRTVSQEELQYGLSCIMR